MHALCHEDIFHRRIPQGSASHCGRPAPGTSLTPVTNKETLAHCTHALACDRGTDVVRGVGTPEHMDKAMS